jgi:hypothetical protein
VSRRFCSAYGRKTTGAPLRRSAGTGDFLYVGQEAIQAAIDPNVVRNSENASEIAQLFDQRASFLLPGESRPVMIFRQQAAFGEAISFQVFI